MLHRLFFYDPFERWSRRSTSGFLRRWAVSLFLALGVAACGLSPDGCRCPGRDSNVLLMMVKAPGVSPLFIESRCPPGYLSCLSWVPNEM